MEITTAEQNKEKKNEKNWGQSQRPLEQHQMHQHSNKKKKRKRKGLRKYLKRLYLKTSQYGKGNNQWSPGSAESPIQDKSKEKHAKTHIKQTIKN